MIHDSVESTGPRSWSENADAEMGREIANHLRPRLESYFDHTVEELLPPRLLILVSRFARVSQDREAAGGDDA